MTNSVVPFPLSGKQLKAPRDVFRGPLRLPPPRRWKIVLIFNVKKNYAKIWTLLKMYPRNASPAPFSDLWIRRWKHRKQNKTDRNEFIIWYVCGESNSFLAGPLAISVSLFSNFCLFFVNSKLLKNILKTSVNRSGFRLEYMKVAAFLGRR